MRVFTGENASDDILTQALSADVIDQRGPSDCRRLSGNGSGVRERVNRVVSEAVMGIVTGTGEDFNGLRGVRGESSGEQAHGEEAANAME